MQIHFVDEGSKVREKIEAAGPRSPTIVFSGTNTYSFETTAVAGEYRMAYQPIENHGIIGNMRTVALALISAAFNLDRALSNRN